VLVSHGESGSHHPAGNAELPADTNKQTGGCGPASSRLQERDDILVQVCAKQQPHGPIVSTRQASEPALCAGAFVVLQSVSLLNYAPSATCSRVIPDNTNRDMTRAWTTVLTISVVR